MAVILPPILDNTITAFEIEQNGKASTLEVSFYFQENEENSSASIDKEYIIVHMTKAGNEMLIGDYKIYRCVPINPVIQTVDAAQLGQRYCIYISSNDLKKNYQFEINTPMQIAIAALSDQIDNKNNLLSVKNDEEKTVKDWFNNYLSLHSSFSESGIRYAITKLNFNLWGNLSIEEAQSPSNFKTLTPFSPIGVNDIQSLTEPFRLGGQITYAKYEANSNIQEIDYLSWYQIKIRDISDPFNIINLAIPELDYQLYPERYLDSDRRSFVLTIDNHSFKESSSYDLTVLYCTSQGYLGTTSYLLRYGGIQNELEDANLDISFTEDLRATSIPEKGYIRLEATLSEPKDVLLKGSIFTYEFYRAEAKNAALVNWVKVGKQVGAFRKEIIYEDVSAEVGIPYWYKIRVCTEQDLKLKRVAEKDNVKVISNGEEKETSGTLLMLDNIFLITKDLMLKVIYNPKVESFKANILDVVSATLGGEYPFIRRNGRQKYRTFNLSGLISCRHECEDLFFREDIIDWDSRTNLTSIPNNDFSNSLFIKDASIFTRYYKADYNLSEDQRNLLYEKMYRDQVIDFLQKDQVILYKSATEGNIFVRLTNVNLTPETSLGRAIWSFTAQATEVEAATGATYLKYFADQDVLSSYAITKTNSLFGLFKDKDNKTIASWSKELYNQALKALASETSLYANIASEIEEQIEHQLGSYQAMPYPQSYSTLRSIPSRTTWKEIGAITGAAKYNKDQKNYTKIGDKYFEKVSLTTTGSPSAVVPSTETQNLQAYTLHLYEDKVVFEKQNQGG